MLGEKKLFLLDIDGTICKGNQLIEGAAKFLRDIKENYKIPLYELIKKDYDSIKQSQYYQDYLDNLGPVKKKFFLDIIESEDYDDFLSLNSE